MTLQEKLDNAVAYLKNLDLAGIEPQVNDDFYYSIQEYETKDVMFWNDAETMARMEPTAGSYAIYLPDVAHKPGIAVSAPEKVKKCVGKVRI